jgi:putative nucleotidyltransferase with HDIG domain
MTTQLLSPQQPLPSVNPRTLRYQIETVGELPTLPEVVQKIVSMGTRPDTSAEDLGHLIERDQVLAAKVLRLANSPFYGFPSRIASVSHAVAVLGLNAVKGLTLCTTAFDMMEAAGMLPLWRHSLGVAIMAQRLASRISVKHTDEVFVAGLLHDIGKVVLHMKVPELVAQVEHRARERDQAIRDTEQEVLGVTHAEVSGWLASAWRLPNSLKEALSFHHQPTLAPKAKLETAIVHVANILVTALGVSGSTDDLVPPLSPPAWELVGLDEESLATCLAEAEEEFQAMDDFL